jgi:hypothetical protein
MTGTRPTSGKSWTDSELFDPQRNLNSHNDYTWKGHCPCSVALPMDSIFPFFFGRASIGACVHAVRRLLIPLYVRPICVRAGICLLACWKESWNAPVAPKSGDVLWKVKIRCVKIYINGVERSIDWGLTPKPFLEKNYIPFPQYLSYNYIHDRRYGSCLVAFPMSVYRVGICDTWQWNIRFPGRNCLRWLALFTASFWIHFLAAFAFEAEFDFKSIPQSLGWRKGRRWSGRALNARDDITVQNRERIVKT